MTGGIGSPQQHEFGLYNAGHSNNTNYYGNSFMYDNNPPGTTGSLGLSSPLLLPRRRYSIGGLPSASMADYSNLLQNSADTTHLSNLLNETSKSITRSSQLLADRRLSQSGLSNYPTVGGISCMDNMPYRKEMSSFNLHMPTNFSSHPNIYTNQQPSNYNTTTSRLFDTTNYLSHSKPFSQYLYPKSMTNSAYNRTYSNPNNQYPHSILSHSRNIPPMHHSSNPALSQTSNWIPSQNYHHLIPQPSLATAYHQNHHHHPSSYSGYSNQHFDHHHYQPTASTLSKLDLDYSKQGETKRQVSFKFDVDTLSIDS